MVESKYTKQITMDESPEYQAFVDKFKPKKTTDDCYTPPEVYDAILDWVVRKYSVDPNKVVRPFYPGGDYERFDYPDGAVVVDNPPFSILSKICKHYIMRGIPFFLFVPALTSFSVLFKKEGIAAICADCDITYENGACVRTNFVTNMEDPQLLAMSAPDLNEQVMDAMKKLLKEQKRSIPKYAYPDNVLTAHMLNYMSAHGVAYEVMRKDAIFIRRLDAQKSNGKDSTIYGSGFLLSEKAAAEKAARMKSDAIRWELSDREHAIIAGLGG